MLIDSLQAALDGVMLGASYSLLGLGFALIFGVLRRLNLAFGPAILVGLSAGSHWHLARPGSLIPVVALTLAGTVLAGVYAERCAFRALARQAPVTSMIASFAVSMQLQELVALWSVSRTLAYPALMWLPTLEIGPFLLRSDGLFMWAGAAVMLGALFLLLYRTRFGRAIRALADSIEGATLVGVNVPALGAAAFILASAVGGVAGVLVATSQQQVTPYFGLWATVKGLTAMLLGGAVWGAGSLPGAVLGGLVLGVVETEALSHFGGQWRDLVAYAVLFLAVGLAREARTADSP